MDYDRIRLVGAQQTTIDLKVFGALPTDSYIVEDITGLEPPPVDVTMVQNPNWTTSFQGRQPEAREIVFTLKIQPNYFTGQTAAQMRSALYAMLFASNDPTLISIYSGDTEIARTYANLSKFDTSLFDSDNIIQLTMECTQSLLTAPASLTSPFQGSPVNSVVVNNPGDAPTWFSTTFIIQDPAPSGTSFQIAVRQGGSSDQIFLVSNPPAGLLVDYAYVTLNTQPGQRQAYVTSESPYLGGTRTMLYQYIDPDSVWPMLLPGDNQIIFNVNSTFRGGNLVYTPQWWGV